LDSGETTLGGNESTSMEKTYESGKLIKYN